MVATISSTVELPSTIPARYGRPRAKPKADPVAASLHVKSQPALLLITPGGTEEPISMPIPRKRDEFTEESIVEWLKASLKAHKH